MIAYQVNPTQTAQVLSRNLAVFRTFNTSVDIAMVKAGKEGVRLQKERMNKGEATSGDRLENKYNGAAYSNRHARARVLKGLQVAYVDLKFTGAMLRDFGLVRYQSRLLEIGFMDAVQAAKMAELEAYYGQDIAAASQAEEDAAISVLENEVLNTLNTLFT